MKKQKLISNLINWFTRSKRLKRKKKWSKVKRPYDLYKSPYLYDVEKRD